MVKDEYIKSIYRVQDYVQSNLSESIKLDELAVVAGFSKYHFHRIFKKIVEEPLNQYVNCLRLESATIFLTYRLDLSITDIAFQIGYTDSTIFSRAFKKKYKISPKEYRMQKSKNCQEIYQISNYNKSISIIKDMISEIDVKFKVIDVEEFKVAYISYIGGFDDLSNEFDNLLSEILNYANKYNLFSDNQTSLISLFHNNPEFTNEKQLRTSMGLKVSNEVVLGDEKNIGILKISAKKYLVGHFEIYQNQYSRAWDIMYNEWLSNDSFKPLQGKVFEMYLNNPELHPLKKHIVDIYLPIEIL